MITSIEFSAFDFSWLEFEHFDSDIFENYCIGCGPIIYHFEMTIVTWCWLLLLVVVIEIELLSLDHTHTDVPTLVDDERESTATRVHSIHHST